MQRRKVIEPRPGSKWGFSVEAQRGGQRLRLERSLQAHFRGWALSFRCFAPRVMLILLFWRLRRPGMRGWGWPGEGRTIYPESRVLIDIPSVTKILLELDYIPHQSPSHPAVTNPQPLPFSSAGTPAAVSCLG